jgi:cell wall-associated NlpC family hydrolase
VDSGIRSKVLRSGLRAVGTAVATLVVLGLTPAVADAAPRRPSDTQIADAQRQADAVAARIGDLSGQLTAAQGTVDAAHAASAIALDEYQATQAAYQEAQVRADAAKAAADQATADLGVAREDVVAFARRSYMEGSGYAARVAALITAADPAQMIERAALLEAAGDHRSDVLDRVTVLQQRATEADTVAREAVAQADALQEQAAGELQVAQAAEVSAREQAAALATQQEQVQTELAQAQQQLTTLIGERAAADRAAQVTRAAAPPAPAAPAAPPAGPPAPAGNTEEAGAGNASAAQRAIDAAMAQRGLPYAWGGGGSRGPGPGQDPDEGVIGFDCSGLTQYAYARAGISIPRNSRAQYASLPKVDSDDLEPGDLVFWGTPATPGGITHVALYLGGGRVVQAPQSGDVIKVSDMWWRNYVGAVRPTA